MTLDALLERADALYRDARFASVGEWKAALPGRKAVGYLPIWVPRELIHAAGMLPVGVSGHGEIEIIRGDAYFQSYICHLPRSVIELGVSGRLDALDGMLFPSTCDVVRNLSGMWKLLFPDKLAKYIDHAQNFEPEVGGHFVQLEWNHLRHALEELSGVAITDERLRASIEVYNQNRRLVAALYDARATTPWAYPSAELYLILRAGNVLPVEEHNAMLESYMADAPRRDLPARDHIRIVVSGAFCEQPPVELVHTLEQAGCYIVDDDLLLAYRWLTEDVVIGADETPMQALGRTALAHSVPCASMYRVDGDNGAALVERVRARDADGVVFAAPSFCDPALLDQPMNVTALEEAGIPQTAFKYSENTGQFQVIREQAGTFADSIRLWGEA